MACAAIGAVLAEAGSEAVVAEGVGGAAAAGAAEGGAAAGAGAAAGDTAFNSALATELGGEAITSSPNALMGATGGAAVTSAALAAGEGGTTFNQSLVDALTGEGVAASGIGIGQAIGPTSLGSGFSWPTLSQIGAGGNILSSIYGMDQANQLKKLAMMQANKSTPWASSGGGDLAAQQLMALISGKTDVSTLPGYAAGKQAVERSGAANGWLGSGNMMAALSQFGGNFYDKAVAQLSGLAGAQFNPVSGGSLALGGARDSAALNLAAMSQINKTATAAGA